ncbi:universal stress protein [Nonomuraea typhae]|uniref:universal stress protein n=1 Tax=Nonomuraea typhae TaxID=2603600 RepID=UPI0012FACA4E|nr:universal stress protein [Nonomuraea typhae]
MTILIAYDGSADAKAAVEFAGKHLTHEPTVVLSVWEPLLVQVKRHPTAGPALLADQGEEWKELAERQAAEGAELAGKAGLTDVTARAVADQDSIWQTIVDVADELDASLIVTGSRGLGGVRSVLLGSVSNHVLHHAHRPTLIVPPAKAG